MQCRHIIGCLLASLILTSSAQAQKGDWRAVQSLKTGSQISVKARRRILCFFQSATANQIVCRPVWPFPFRGPSEVRFDRQSVREVRLEHSQKIAAVIGAAVGAGAGVAIGASRKGSGSLTRGGNAIVGGLGGALIGMTVGAMVPIFFHGKIIYRR